MFWYTCLPETLAILAIPQVYLNQYFMLMLVYFLAWTKLCNTHPFQPCHMVS